LAGIIGKNRNLANAFPPEFLCVEPRFMEDRPSDRRENETQSNGPGEVYEIPILPVLRGSKMR
jgi:hypothetical protein